MHKREPEILQELNEKFIKLHAYELNRMTMIDYVEMLKQLSKKLQDQGLKFNIDLYNQVKESFINTCSKSWSKFLWFMRESSICG